MTKNTYSSLEKLLTVAGIGVVLIGFVAGIFNLSMNHGFIHDFYDLVYYLDYLILLVGGAIIGLLFAKKNRLFSSVLYAFLAMILFEFFDILRFSSQNLFGDLPFPWGKILFSIMPLVALAVTLLIAIILRVRKNASNRFAKALFIVALIGVQLFYLLDILHTMATLNQGSDVFGSPVALTIGGYLGNPLLVTLFAYLLFGAVKQRFDRLFYATFLGGFIAFLTLVLWEFRTNPSLDATNIFEITILIITIVLSVALIWLGHRSLGHSKK